MRLRAMAVVALLLVLGCQSSPPPTPPSAVRPDTRMFAPVAMRIHPIFTQIRDWTDDGKPDGIEALIEFQDQFGDPTKASGRVVFELFEYRRGDPDPRGNRVVNPWIGSLQTQKEQEERWNRTSRTYSFQLAMPGIRTDRPYVLSAMFELSGGGRYFDRIILMPQAAPRTQKPAPQEPTSATPAPEATQPTPRTPQR